MVTVRSDKKALNPGIQSHEKNFRLNDWSELILFRRTRSEKPHLRRSGESSEKANEIKLMVSQLASAPDIPISSRNNLSR